MDGQKIIVEEVEIFNNIVSIRVKHATDEQVQTLVDKINEKYGTENTISTIVNEDISNLRGRDIIKPYFVSGVISIVLVLTYMMIRYRKLNPIQIFLGVSIDLILILLLILSIFAIVRIPINQFTIPVILVIVVTYIIIEMVKVEKLSNKKS